jgi:hypothetical protein
MFGIFKKSAPPPPPQFPTPEDDPADPLCLVIIPALVAILLNAERQKGSPLTEAEVIAFRDDADCIAMPASVAAEVEVKRGYPDILAEAAWVEWQRVRTELGQE